MVRFSVRQLFDLSGKAALVTGVSNLGYDAAEALAELGAAVVVTRRKQEDADRVAARLAAETGAATRGVVLEATDEQSWSRVVRRMVDEFGTIDILVNNAGGRRPTRESNDSGDPAYYFLEGRATEDWRDALEANLTSVFLGCKTAAPYMKRAGHGKIINIASIDGIQGRDLRIYPGTGVHVKEPDYLAGKAGVINLTKGAAAALGPHGVNVNCISPGGFFRDHPPAFEQNYSRQVPLGRMGRDRIDLKGAVAYLASPASDYVAGHNLVVDGGLTIW